MKQKVTVEVKIAMLLNWDVSRFMWKGGNSEGMGELMAESKTVKDIFDLNLFT